MRILAATNGLVAGIAPPFSREEDPKDLQVGPDFAKAAFALTLDEPYAGPLSGQDGVYVISYNKQMPRETPSLEQVRDRVVSDFKHSQAMMQAQMAGRGFYQTLTNGLAQQGTLASPTDTGTWTVTANAGDRITLTVSKTSNANTVEVADAVQRLVIDVRRQLPHVLLVLRRPERALRQDGLHRHLRWRR
jgi:hypothetical protein